MMKRMLMMVLALASGIALAADDAQLPTRRVESVSVAQAESTAPVAAVVSVAPATPAPAAPPAGSVSQWLQLQASGRVASPVIQKQSAAEQELANQRLLDSYKNQGAQSAAATATAPTSASSNAIRTTTP